MPKLEMVEEICCPNLRLLPFLCLHCVPSLYVVQLSVGMIKLMVIDCNGLFFEALLIYSHVTICFDSRALCQPLSLKIKT